MSDYLEKMQKYCDTVYMQEAKDGTGKLKKYNIYEVCSDTLEFTANEMMQDKTYGSELTLVEEVLKSFPENDDEKIVAMKIALIDLTNSTHLSQHRAKINLKEITDHIVRDKEFDDDLKNGRPGVVERLAKCSDEIAITSFASKYCKYHNSLVYGRDDYSIIDGIVMHTLPGYCKKYGVERAGRNKVISFTYIDNLRKEGKYQEFNELISRVLCNANAEVKDQKNARDRFDTLMWYTNR